MNRTQKSALGGLIIWSLALAFFLFMLVEMVFLKTLYLRFHLFYGLFIGVAVILGLLFMLKKQRPKEVETDEYDRLIQLKAVLVSFVSVWILLAAVIFICRFTVGLEGSITIWAMTLINFTIFVASMLIFWAAILIQYGRGGKQK